MKSVESPIEFYRLPADEALKGLFRPYRARVSVGVPLPRPLAWAWSFYISKHPQGKNPIPRPLGGEGGPQPALSPAGAGRVRGSKPKPAQPNASGSDHPMATTFSTNSSGASRTMPWEIRSTVFPRAFRYASRSASRLAWLGCPCTLPSSSTIRRRSRQPKSARYGPTGC